MALENTNKKTVVISSGSELELPYNFYCRATSDIKLRVVDTVGVVTDVVSGFTVTLNEDYDGGKVTISTAYPSGYTITIYRDTERTQNSEYGQGQRFDSSKTEGTFDKVVSMIQEQDERLDRSLKVDIEDAGSTQGTTLKKEDRKDKVLGFDEDGKVRIDASYSRLIDVIDIIDQLAPGATTYTNQLLPGVSSVRDALDKLATTYYTVINIEDPVYGYTGTPPADWSDIIDACIEVALDNVIAGIPTRVKFGNRAYSISRPIKCYRKNNANTNYEFIKGLWLDGEQGYDSSSGTRIVKNFAVGERGVGIALQAARRCKISKIRVLGQGSGGYTFSHKWRELDLSNDVNWWNVNGNITAGLADPNRSNRIYNPDCGISIDPLGKENLDPLRDDYRYSLMNDDYLDSAVSEATRGSSLVLIEDCTVEGCEIGYAVGLSDNTKLGEMVIFDRPRVTGCKSGFAYGHTQTRGSIIRDLSAENIELLIDGIRYGDGQGSVPTVFGGVAVYIYCLQNFIGGWQGIKWYGFFGELVYSLGLLPGGFTNTMDGCHIQMSTYPMPSTALINEGTSVIKSCDFTNYQPNEGFVFGVRSNYPLTFDGCVTDGWIICNKTSVVDFPNGLSLFYPTDVGSSNQHKFMRVVKQDDSTSSNPIGGAFCWMDSKLITRDGVEFDNLQPPMTSVQPKKGGSTAVQAKFIETGSSIYFDIDLTGDTNNTLELSLTPVDGNRGIYIYSRPDGSSAGGFMTLFGTKNIRQENNTLPLMKIKSVVDIGGGSKRFIGIPYGASVQSSAPQRWFRSSTNNNQKTAYLKTSSTSFYFDVPLTTNLPTVGETLYSYTYTQSRVQERYGKTVLTTDEATADLNSDKQTAGVVASITLIGTGWNRIVVTYDDALYTIPDTLANVPSITFVEVIMPFIPQVGRVPVTLTSGSNIAVADTGYVTYLGYNQYIYGEGIPTDTKIVSVSGNNYTLSKPATLSGSYVISGCRDVSVTGMSLAAPDSSSHGNTVFEKGDLIKKRYKDTSTTTFVDGFLCETSGKGGTAVFTNNFNRRERFIQATHSASGAYALNCLNQYQEITASSNITSFTLSNRPTGLNSIIVYIKAINWGAYTITFSDGTTAFSWSGNVLPNLTASGTDIIILEITSTEVNARYEKDVRNA